VLYFVKIVGYKAFPLPTRTGGRWPAYASALGKVLMAFGPADPLQILPSAGLKPLTPYTIIDPHRLQRHVALSALARFVFDNVLIARHCADV